MRVPTIFKRIGNYLGGFFLSLCCIIVGFSMVFTSSNYDINKLPKHEGKVVKKGSIDRSSSLAGRGSMTNRWYYIKLDNESNYFGTYDRSKDYSYLDNNIHIGDILEIKVSSIINKDIYEIIEIKKKDAIILNSDKFIKKEKVGGYIALIGGFIILGLTFYQDKKYYWKKGSNNINN